MQKRVCMIFLSLIILLSMVVPAFALEATTEPTSAPAEESADYNKLICATWYIDLNSKTIDDYVFPETTFTWNGAMEALTTGTPSSIKVFKSPDPTVDGNSGCLFNIADRYGLSLANASCVMIPGADGPEVVSGKTITCGVFKIKIVSPDPVPINNEKLYKWFKSNGFFSAGTPDQGGSSDTPNTEAVAGLNFSFWQLNEIITLPDPLESYSAEFTLPYVDETKYKTFSFSSTSLRYSKLFAYSFSSQEWKNDKYRYVYFPVQISSNAGLLRWLKDNARLVVQSTPGPRPTEMTDLIGTKWVFDSTIVKPSESFNVIVTHYTDYYPNRSQYSTIKYNSIDANNWAISGNNVDAKLFTWNSVNGFTHSVKWIKFAGNCTDRNFISWLQNNAVLTEWGALEPPVIPPYVPPEQGGVLGPEPGSGGGSGGGGSSGGNDSGWITGGGLIGTQPLPGLNAGFLSWLASTMDGIMNVNLFGFFSLADILSFCLTISIIMVLLKFFGG